MNVLNLWTGKYRQALSQEMHEKHNAQNYPGTRQLCMHCDQPTERCEEDSLDSIDGEPLCPDCYEKEKANEPTR